MTKLTIALILSAIAGILIFTLVHANTKVFAQSLTERFIAEEILTFGTPVKFSGQVYILNNNSQRLYPIRVVR